MFMPQIFGPGQVKLFIQVRIVNFLSEIKIRHFNNHHLFSSKRMSSSMSLMTTTLLSRMRNSVSFCNIVVVFSQL